MARFAHRHLWVLGPWMYAVFYAWKCSNGLVYCAVTEKQCLTAAVCVTAPASCFDTADTLRNVGQLGHEYFSPRSDIPS